MLGAPLNPTYLRSRRAGFTLNELLTVIAIIGVLAAILIPVVGSVRASARKSTCSSNLRQIGMSTLLFAGERGRFPATLCFPGGPVVSNWILELVNGGYSADLRPISDDVDMIWICPSARRVHAAPVAGNASTYGANAVALGDVELPGTGTATSLSRVGSPSRTSLAMDGHWRSSQSMFWVSVHPVSLPPTPAHPPGTSGLNVVFMDGHVESRRFAELPTSPADLFWSGQN